MAEASVTGKVPMQQELPLEAIKDAIEKGINEVICRIARRNHRGQLQILVSNWAIATADLVSLDMRLLQMAGGGEYTVDAMNPVNPLERVLPPFMVRIEGAPRPADTQSLSGQMQQPAGMPSGGGMMNPFQPVHGQAPMLPGLLVPAGQQSPLPLAGVPGYPPQYSQMPGQPGAYGWAAGLAPQQQADYLRHYETQLPPGASVPSDQMALKQVKDMKDEVAAARAAEAEAEAKLEAERKANAAEMRELRMRMEKSEKDAREREHASELKRMEEGFNAKIDKLMEMQRLSAAAVSPPPPKQVTMLDYAPLITALVPVALGFMQTGKEQQTTMMTTLASLSAPKKDGGNTELIKVLGPLLMPLALKMMERSGPDAQSRAYEVLADSNMQQMAMMAQFIQTMTPQDPGSPWAPFLMQAAQGIMETVGSYMESKKQQQQMPPHIIHQGHAQQLPGGAPQQPSMGGATVIPPEEPLMETPEQVVNVIMMSPQVPPAFKTQEWYNILLALHQQRPVEEVSLAFIGHVGDLMETGQLPIQINTLFTDGERVVSGLLRGMPIYHAAPAYTEAVIKAILQHLAAAAAAGDAGVEGGEGDDDEGEAPPGGVTARAESVRSTAAKQAKPIVTPAPAAAE